MNKTIKLLAAAIMMAMPLCSRCQYSWTRQYSSLATTDQIIRMDRTATYTVTSFHLNAPTINNHHASFKVEHSGVEKYFTTNPYTPGMMPQHPAGMEVNDIQMLDRTCYFCGSVWQETDNLLYDIFWGYYYEVIRKGVIGRFDIDDVLSGSGYYEVAVIPETKELARLAVHAFGAVAVGTLADGHTSCIAELQENTPNYYNYRIFKSVQPDEVFMDVVSTNYGIVTLSRFSNPSNTDRYRKYFALREGGFYDFYNTLAGLYAYNTHLLNGDGFGFNGLDRILLSTVNHQDAVTVSYLLTSQSSVQNHPVFYKINYAGGPTTAIQYAGGLHSYKTLVDAKFNTPIYETTNMVMLLEDDNGNSALRFPLWQRVQDYNDTILYTTDYSLKSVAPFQYMSNTLETKASGSYPAPGRKHAEFFQSRIHTPPPFWTKYTCMDLAFDEWRVVNRTIEPETWNENVSLYYQSPVMQYVAQPFESRIISPLQKCQNGQQ